MTESALVTTFCQERTKNNFSMNNSSNICNIPWQHKKLFRKSSKTRIPNETFFTYIKLQFKRMYSLYFCVLDFPEIYLLTVRGIFGN